MADSKITALTALTAADPVNDMFPIVDVSDTSMAASGTTKRISANNILSSSPTATGALTVTGLVTAGSATITGDLTVDTSTLKVDSTNNRVGIGTASPSDTLSVVGGNASNLLIDNGGQQYTQLTLQRNSALNSGGDILINGTASTMNIRMLAVGSMKFYTSPTAGSPVERYNIDDTGISTWSVAGTTAMTLNSTGLGIGTATINERLVVQTALTGTTAGSNVVGRFQSNASGYDAHIALGDNVNPAGRIGYLSGDLYLWTNGAERLRIDTSGHLLVGKTALSDTVVGLQIQSGGAVTSTLAASVNATTTLTVYSTGASAYRFFVGMGGTVSATNPVISAISDARLKENVQDIDVGLAAILSLKPRKFDWKAGKGKDIKGDRGFIAQEFETVFPNLIDEWKDPAPEGEAPYKSVRQDLIPVLVKAIQELTARVQTLEAR